MDDIWICSQCETLNENTDKCIVCGMAYKTSVEVVKREDKIEETIHNRIKIDPSRIRFNFPDKLGESINRQITKKKQNVSPIVSFFTAIRNWFGSFWNRILWRYNIRK